MAISVHSLSLHFPPKSKSNSNKKNPPPIFISTNPSHLHLSHLQTLFQSANLSPHRFPLLDENGRAKPVSLDKLRIAVANSSVVVSVFCRENSPSGGGGQKLEAFGLGQLVERATPVSESNGYLVGFGRAISDSSLTASIFDVMVAPRLQRMGIGRRIVTRIVRVLTGRGIYDISAICSEKERFFFEACGFGNDILESTTMMYTKDPPSHTIAHSMVKHAGRMLLLVPPPRQLFLSKETKLLR